VPRPRQSFLGPLCLALTALVYPTRSGATEPLTLSQALQRALSQNPGLAGAASHVRSAALHTRDESRPPNPTLDVTEENFGGDLGGHLLESTISASQMLELGGDRGARAHVARGLEHVAQAELSGRQREVVWETAEAFLRAWSLERRLERLRRSEEIAEAAISGARERTRIGAAPPVEGLRAEGVLAERAIERRGLEAEVSAARRDLALEWGSSTADFDSLVLPPAEVPPLPPPDSLIADLERHPDRLRAAAETEVEAARVREARAMRIPDLTLQGGVRRLEEISGTGFVAGVSLPIPLWNRGGSLVASAAAERSSAEARQREVERRLEGDLRSAYDSLFAARDREEIVRTRLLPASRDALAQLQKGYRAGRFTYLDQLDGQRAALEAELTAIGAERDLWIARFTLERLIGRSLDEVAGGRR